MEVLLAKLASLKDINKVTENNLKLGKLQKNKIVTKRRKLCSKQLQRMVVKFKIIPNAK